MTFLLHVTHAIGASLHSLLGNHATHLVTAGLHSLLRNHVTYLVAACLHAFLANHAAYLVGACALLRNHAAYFVSACALLRNHAANLVATSLRTLFVHVTTDRVRHLFGVTLTLVTNAIDGFPLLFGNPYLAARLTWWALNLDDLRLAWHVSATTSARIVDPTATLLNALFDHRTGRASNLGFPMAAANLAFFGVMDRLARCVGAISIASLIDRLANVVANFPCLGFPDGLANGVGASLCLVDWLANGIFAGLRFVDWPFDRVAYVARLGFPDRLANGVADLTSLRFVDWLADRIANVTSLGFPDWLAHGVLTGAIMRLVDRLADGVLAIAIFRDVLVAYAVDLLFVVDRLVAVSIAGVLLFLVNDLTTGLHYGTTLSLGCFIARSTVSTVLYVGGSAVGCEGGAR